MSDAMVNIEHLTKQFDPSQPPALQAVDALIPKGKIVGLAGPDGAGKTTLIRLIAGLLTPTKGRSLLQGTIQPQMPRRSMS